MPPKTHRAKARTTTRKFANPLGEADHVDYKDTNLLRKFISEKGKIRSRRVTRVTARQQRLIAAAVKNAREMALLPYPSSTKQS
ncbi:30S ribosomal protein S18 [Nocardiopsis exhalans]|uniref:Small ribosomal subunit protein bS18 n=1 Tax=Nocardiopsis exhalans TaxID=163604 RepID=A0ABY5D3C0_9ACTN|nr:30S ribosomal protein S18 [Nocardiopsis exhalans]USY18480.1 30S ribosomal protein S18 [Nocardiopsis exhalans]